MPRPLATGWRDAGGSGITHFQSVVEEGEKGGDGAESVRNRRASLKVHRERSFIRYWAIGPTDIDLHDQVPGHLGLVYREGSCSRLVEMKV